MTTQTTTPTSRVLNIARAVAAESPLASLGAALSYSPEFSLEELGASAVCLVAPGKIEFEKGTHRYPFDCLVTVEIAILKRIPVQGAEMTAEIETLAVQRETLLKYFSEHRRPAAFQSAYIREIESPALYDPELLRQLGIFYTLISLTAVDWSE